MSNFELNKLAAAILLASIIVMITGFVSDALYQPDLTVESRGYQIAVEESSGVANNNAKEEKVQEVVDIKLLMASASSESGAKVFNKCKSCHTIEKDGPHRVGPNLYGIVNNKYAHASGYSYSKALQSVDAKWDYDNLSAFLHNPKKHLAGTKMSFAGLSNYKDIADVIKYLEDYAK